MSETVTSEALAAALTNFRFEAGQWRFVDLRIDIPPRSFGSDAINPHTQYSNPVAIAERDAGPAVGASFTLGAGNEMICAGAEFIVNELDGFTVGDLMARGRGFYETLTNPLQLRWLSPNAGLPLMAGGLVVNTLLDAASKSVGLPAWEFLARLPTDVLMSLINLRHLDERYDAATVRRVFDLGLSDIDARCARLKAEGLPVYYTTWIGHDAETIAKQIVAQHRDRGITMFKIKIGSDIEGFALKLSHIRQLVPEGIDLCVDANQTLDADEARAWLRLLSDQDVKWLEEPFAPDNVRLFGDLARYKQDNGLSCEVVTGENCPNHFTASALIDGGIDRFQADPCRMLGLVDAILVTVVAGLRKCTVTPHAGGSGLDELSPHIQLFNLARIRTDLEPSASLTENVGFCSRFFTAPTNVKQGRALAQQTPGFLVGLDTGVMQRVRSYKEGASWLTL
ncbi:L-fuconate dehydratase [Mycobacterium simulans]|uniref:L-fuconate dehydratase n=1 Tax=Mycobacterium simulans TaxID=627089 RepID=A0A7Z7IJV2_9MYCO|nr:enolase C-terminal domain-like protein [Mycobacterium simulans]SOJ54920.1 L-fuconate dehydratase [Mycobacterium simulans]